jgi:DNA-binding MarR family transcriptional regulator
MKQDQKLRTVFQTLSEIAIIGQLTDGVLRQVLPEELSIASFGVLNHFARLGLDRESPTKLARAFQVTKGAMTYTLQHLEELGYVTIEADPTDARGKIVRVTKAGARAREAAIGSVTPGMKRMLEVIPAEDFARAMPFLTKLRQVLDAARD